MPPPAPIPPDAWEESGRRLFHKFGSAFTQARAVAEGRDLTLVERSDVEHMLEAAESAQRAEKTAFGV